MSNQQRRRKFLKQSAGLSAAAAAQSGHSRPLWTLHVGWPECVSGDPGSAQSDPK